MLRTAPRQARDLSSAAKAMEDKLGHTPERSDGEPEVQSTFGNHATSAGGARFMAYAMNERSAAGPLFLSENLFSGEKKEATPKRTSVYSQMG